MKKVKKLYSDFKPERYELYLKHDLKNTILIDKLRIDGKKTGRPSHRITFHQKNLKITKAELIRHDRAADVVQTVDRINHLSGFQEVRLHTKNIMRPGSYSIEIIYRLDQEKAQAITARSASPSREFLPCVDEPEAWAEATFEIKS